ncbi:MAG: NAD(P)H-binding protein [Longimicrobiales bacterium]
MDTEYHGVTNTLAALQMGAFAGRLLYMTSMGATTRSLSRRFLNRLKRNTLQWRRRAEDQIRMSGLAYTIVRAGRTRFNISECG